LKDGPEWTRDQKRKGEWVANAGRKLTGGLAGRANSLRKISLLFSRNASSAPSETRAAATFSVFYRAMMISGAIPTLFGPWTGLKASQIPDLVIFADF
jgi:hypothetical protein